MASSAIFSLEYYNSELLFPKKIAAPFLFVAKG
jgi:hypothetical protein